MMWPALFAFNRAPDSDGGGGAAGGAAGGADGGAAGEKPLTRAEVEGLVGGIVSKHINSRGFVEKLRSGLATADDVGGIKSILEELRAGKKTGDGEGAADEGKNADPEVAKKMSKMEERLVAAERKAKASEDEALQMKTESAKEKERGALTSALQGKIKPALLPAAVSLLYNERHMIKRNKDGDIVFEMKRKDYIDELTVEEGVLEWLTTPEGKEYVPPVVAGGTGDKDGAKDGGGRKGILDKMTTGTADERTNAALNVIALG
jgi:hypothetical protein